MSGDPNITYRRRPDSVSAELGVESAVLDLEGGSYFGLNETASFVWRLLERPRTIDQLLASVMAEYAVDAQSCRAAVGRLLDRLENEGLVLVERSGGE